MPSSLPAVVLAQSQLTWAVIGGGVVLGVVLLSRLGSGLRSRRFETSLADLHQANAELSGRLSSMGESLSSRQGELARVVADRLDSVQARLGQHLDRSTHRTGEGLARLHERLGIIDAAQTRLAGLTEEIVGLRDILANKQARGAFGQGQMEAIVRDGLPPGAYAFQPTLSNKTRPDCTVKLPGDKAALVIDAKFPLEGFLAFRDARGDAARAQAAARIRTDMGKHVRDIAERYLLPGETQEVALLFVPSEAVFAELSDQFPDVVQRANKARVMVVSPTLLALAIQLMRTVARDARMREQAHLIQAEVRGLLDEVRRLGQRTAKLDDHFRLARKDVGELAALSDGIIARAERIDALDCTAPGEPANDRGAAPPTLFSDSGGVVRP